MTETITITDPDDLEQLDDYLEDVEEAAIEAAHSRYQELEVSAESRTVFRPFSKD